MDREIYLRKFVRRAAQKFNLTGPPSPDEVRFPQSYKEVTSPRRAARDLVMLGVAEQGEAVDMTRDAVAGDAYDLRLCSSRMRPLGTLVPLLQNLGLIVLDQRQYRATVGSKLLFLRSFIVAPAGWRHENRRKILDALSALVRGDVEDDSLNQLVSRAGLGWREVKLLRTYCNYYLQLGGRVGRSRLYQALLNEIVVTQLLFSYFQARFRPDDPKHGSLDVLAEIRQRLIDAFDKVQDITDDRLLRDIFNIIDATLRTSFYAQDARQRNTVALKIDSLGVISAPAPRPAVEIYVHSPLFEGVHLRGAKVARGGIRWSDRSHDLRTEILDLMQTQMVKNALIVPQGAKGGFVLKASSEDPVERQAQGRKAYRDFISALLILTDNPGKPNWGDATGIVAYDDEDPYLVVAADKGTATWSDLANEVAKEQGFWLGDAFATGGSNGFHHKRLGITARGAWVCVRRHFRELDQDIENEPFTVVGVGSMDGDVFGNGMLETDKIRLLGAFSGDHIFIDPNPDPRISYAERRRLFELPRSSWLDYDKTKISPGGGVYRRDAKDIELSPEARSMLGARNRLVDGEALIRLLLTAPVDLLWMGGIGTYVKASSETDDSVGDRANDGARVNAIQLRAKVAGEGANLAFTRHARVEYARNGGKINSDAVDNSAGVDLSDHEVNLKILLQGVPGSSPNAAPDSTHRLLEAMTEDVCAAVLGDSDRQSLCLSLERQRSLTDLQSYMDLADRFEGSGLLDRRSDAFPTRKEIAARSEKGLTRPELALLMAQAKLALKRALLDEPQFQDAGWTKRFSTLYFPSSLRASFPEEILRHPLAREIAATVVSNRIVDHAGARFLLFDETAAPEVLVGAVETYLTFDEILEGDRWRLAIRELGGRMRAEQGYEYLQQLEDILTYLCRWAIQRRRRLQPIEQTILEWQGHLRRFFSDFPQVAQASIGAGKARFDEIFESRLRAFPFLVDLAETSRKDIVVAERLFDGVAKLLGLRELALFSAQTAQRDAWENRLQRALEERLQAASARITAILLRLDVADPAIFFETVSAIPSLAQLRRLRQEVVAAAQKTIAPIAFFVLELESFIEVLEQAAMGMEA